MFAGMGELEVYRDGAGHAVYPPGYGVVYPFETHVLEAQPAACRQLLASLDLGAGQ